MNEMTSQMQCRPCDFARRAGVTVRALHHYDRLGLLKPSSRTAAGYRLYGPSDLERLQQIVTLKFIGFSLREIKGLLAGADPRAALKVQRQTLEQKRTHLDSAIAAIGQAERVLRGQEGQKWEAFAKIIEAIQMQTNTDWIKKYYNEKAQKLLAKRRKLWTPKRQEEGQAEWANLLKDIEEAVADKVDAASAVAQKLAERHTRLVEGFTGGSADIRQGLVALWKDRAHWPAEFRRRVMEPLAQRGVKAAQGSNPMALSEAGQRFLEAAVRARWTDKYFDADARKLLKERQGLASEKAKRKWAVLRKEIEKATRHGMDPSGPKAKALAKRHASLVAEVTGGNASIREGLVNIWKDRANWPTQFLSQAGSSFLEEVLKRNK